MEEGIFEIVLGGAMFTLMFGMGLTLGADDFRRIATSPRATIVGTVLQLAVMPAVGIALAYAFDLSAILSAGIVIVAACPGGMFSNMYVHLARGHTALSITLTATSTFVTLFTLPLWIQFALTTFSADGAAPIEMPVLDTALRLGMLTILPVAVGMGVRHRWPDTTGWERKLSVSAAIVIVGGTILESTSRPEIPIDEFVTSLAPTATFALAAIVIGIILPPLFRISARDTVTIAVELIVKNTLLGIVLVGRAGTRLRGGPPDLCVRDFSDSGWDPFARRRALPRKAWSVRTFGRSRPTGRRLSGRPDKLVVFLRLTLRVLGLLPVHERRVSCPEARPVSLVLS